jgi:dienelactone hydrolase
MAEVLLFHHAQGLTPGVLAFAQDLRAAGHRVHAPDLYDGRVFADLPAGIAHAESIGFEAIIERGKAAAAALPASLVYAGFSLGVLPAQALAQTRPGARGALFFHSSVPPHAFGATWPTDLRIQTHTMADDPFGDLDVAADFAAAVPGAELFLYPGAAHLFTDRSLPAYDEAAARLVLERTLAFLAAVG